MVPGAAMSQRLYSNASGKTEISHTDPINHSLRAVVSFYSNHPVASLSQGVAGFS